MKPMRHIFLLSVLSLFAFSFFGSAAEAEVLKYTDREGNTHFVDRPEKVPEEYRSQLNGQDALPPISRSKPGRKLYEREHYSDTATPTGARVEIFVTSWCQYCKELEAYLTSQGVPFVLYDIEKSAKGKRLHEQLGGGGVPVTRIGNEVIHGFDLDRLKKLLRTGSQRQERIGVAL